jgi:hypothetical protein
MEFEVPSKFILCVLPTQFGKTFTVISRIETEINQDCELGRSIHVVFTMNTLLNNKQFAKRLSKIEDTFGKGSVCVFASEYKGNDYVHVKNRSELQGICFDKETCPRVVVMCSNTRRYDDGLEFLKIIDKNKGHVIRAFAYYDELHKYITDSVRDQIEKIHNLKIVNGIVALTATPEKIWKESGFWAILRLINLSEFNDESYAGFNDMVYNCIDDSIKPLEDIRTSRSLGEFDKQSISYIDYVLQKNPHIIQNNTRTFIPVHNRRAGHDYVRDLVFKVNNQTVVVVLNGVDKNLKYIDNAGHMKTISLTDGDSEICEIISRRIKDYKLEHRPLVITGFLCVGMGQTLTCNSLGSFTSAIFGQLDLSNDEIYQLFGRITGRMKAWEDKYIQTEVYCPTVIMHRCNVMEQCARNMAIENNDSDVSRKDYLDHMDTMGDIGKAAKDNIRPDKKKPGSKAGDKIEDPCTSVPRIFNLSPETYNSFKKVGGAWITSPIYDEIKKADPELETILKSLVLADSIQKVSKGESYKRKIEVCIKHSAENRKHKAWVKKEFQTKDCYLIYLDGQKPRIIVEIYWGSKNTPMSLPLIEP